MMAVIVSAVSEIICVSPFFQKVPLLRIEYALDTATATFFRDTLRMNNPGNIIGVLLNQPQLSVSADSTILDNVNKNISIELKVSNRNNFPLSDFFIYTTGALDSVTKVDSISIERMLDRHSKDGYMFAANSLELIPKKVINFGSISFEPAPQSLGRLKTLKLLGLGGYTYADPMGVSHRGMFCYSMDIGTGSVKQYPRLNYRY
jgi:hypothetical protein